MDWLIKLKASLKKSRVDKLPEEELNGQIGNFPGQDASAGAGDPSAMGAPPMDPMTGMPMDPSMMGGAMPPMDPSMMPEPQPLVWNNRYLVKTDGPEFIVELTPGIVPVDPMAAAGPQSPLLPSESTQMGNSMDDKTLNPNADSQELAKWLQEQDNFQEKPFSTTEKETVDPLSREEEGLPVNDTGNEQKVKVHKKASSDDITPGANRSNPYYPCSVCSNYDAKNGECSQGLDVEKVQAAKSCSWLNSNFHPFGDPKDEQYPNDDKEIYKSNVADLPGNSNTSNAPTKAASKGELKDKLKKMW